MTKTNITAHLLQWFLLTLLAIAVVGFLTFTNFYGAFLASITAFIAWGSYKKKRWAYFAAAAWGLACYQLAKQGYEFQDIKYLVMILGVAVIPIALFLHEFLAKKQNVPTQESVTHAVNNDDMPL